MECQAPRVGVHLARLHDDAPYRQLQQRSERLDGRGLIRLPSLRVEPPDVPRCRRRRRRRRRRPHLRRLLGGGARVAGVASTGAAVGADAAIAGTAGIAAIAPLPERGFVSDGLDGTIKLDNKTKLEEVGGE
jgi:hypothetical protein